MSKAPRWERVRTLFHEALDKPPAERSAFVRAQAEDDEICGEVESLLAAHDGADGFLSKSPIGAERVADPEAAPSLSPGSRIGAFEIVGLLGSGGMGEVYRARDTRLDRPVAIKLLAPDLAGDARNRERFEREARLLSKVTHPHICTLYDVDAIAADDSELRFLVMELLEGETLAARLRRGKLPIEQALKLAAEIVDALAAAHALGVVHRDLKPANIVLTKSGVKLIDFGLARLRTPVTTGLPPVSGDTNDPLTAAGAIAGTLPYMAPEQVRGEEADARADLFAFGAVLYEMLTGTRAFAAGSQPDLIAAILTLEPAPLAARQPLASPPLQRLVTACLAKNPDDRWQTARDLLRELTWLRDGNAATHSIPQVRQKARGWLGWAAALAMVLLAIVAIFFFRQPATALAPTISFSLYPPEGTRFPRGTADMALSPDGSRLVFAALSADGTRRLWMRRFEAVAARLLDGTEGGNHPFWAPDGRSIGFFADGKLKRIAEAGGPPQIVCDAPISMGGTWGRDGTILFSMSGVIRRVPEAGGTATAVTALDATRQERSHRWPVFLPDGRRFLYTVHSNDRDQAAAYQGALDSSRTHRLIAADSNVGLAGPYLFSLSKHSLIANVYDPDLGQVTGEPITIAEPIDLDSPLRSGGAFTVAANGALAYRSASPDSRLIWFDRTGREVGSFPDRGDFHNPWLSPDEKRVVVEKTDPATGRHTIWMLDLQRGTTSRLVDDVTGAHSPVWSPDGARVLFSSNRLGAVDLYSMRVDGADRHDLVLSSGTNSFVPTDWSPDGRLLLYQVHGPGQIDLWTGPAANAQEGRPWVATAANERQGQFSPDMKWIAYTSDEAGGQEVYVQRFPEADGKWRASTRGGAQPRWRRDGKELFYLAPDGNLMAADVRITANGFETGPPRALFSTGITTSFVDRRNQYLVTRDGQRFLVNISAEDANSSPITVVSNWQTALKKSLQ